MKFTMYKIMSGEKEELASFNSDTHHLAMSKAVDIYHNLNLSGEVYVENDTNEFKFMIKL